MFRSVRIAYESFGRSKHVGTYDEGQFILMDGVRVSPDELAVVLHTFDWEGRHRNTLLRRVGDAGTREVYAATADELLAGLGSYRFGNVTIRPFDVTVGGARFTLRRTFIPIPPFFEWEFMPYSMFLGWPFDGTYDT